MFFGQSYPFSTNLLFNKQKQNKRGVVKFFNVCNQEQKEIETKITIAGSSERKREKVLSSIDKGSFLDRLKENDDSDRELEQPSTVKELVREFYLQHVLLVEICYYLAFLFCSRISLRGVCFVTISLWVAK